MKRLGAAFVLAVFLLGTIASEAALARGGGRGHAHGARAHAGAGFYRAPARVGVVVASPVFVNRGAYAAPYYAYPPPVYYYYPRTPYYPPEYIEQGYGQPVPQQQPAPAVWHYCRAVDNYYPYVKTCPGGWQPIVPQPPPS